MTNYEDIINLPHHTSDKRQRMSREMRAAQFSPFAALTGHDEAIEETARLTDKRLELDETTKTILNDKFGFLMNNILSQPEITVTYFIPDAHKDGGAYADYTGCLRKFDYLKREVHFTDKTVIPVDNIVNIESEIFPTELGNNEMG